MIAGSKGSATREERPAYAILSNMKSAILLVCAAALPLAAQVKFTETEKQIDVAINGQPFTTFFFGPEAPKPYLHPLRSASGKIVTRQYPMESLPNESKDHPHHRGLWFTHGDVNGFDFWANEESQKSEKKGKIVVKKIGDLSEDKGRGWLEGDFDWVDPQGQRLLTETRKMTFYADPKLRIIDFDITLRAAQKVVFGDTKEGAFAIRLATGLEEPQRKPAPGPPPRTGLMVASDGKRGEKEVWGKRAPWVDYSGELDGERLGVAIFDHPANPKHPTYWHSRSYGLFAANIFGEHDFYADKAKNGSVTVQPGGTLRFRYRVVIHPGDTESAGIAGLYAKYR